MGTARFRLNDQRVMFEVFDEEVLVLNIEAGIYYSLSGASAEIWQWLVGGADAEAVKQAVRARYAGDAAAIDSAVTRLIDKLAAEELVISDDRDAPAFAIPDAAGERQPFVEPAIEIYNDLQDLLLLDPVHDVDERGWPIARMEPPAGAKA